MSKRNRDRRQQNKTQRLQERSRSNLLDKMGQFVGFGFTPHPTNPTYFLQMCF